MKQHYASLIIIAVVCVFFVSNATAQSIGSRPMHMFVDGNNYQFYDLLNDTLNRLYIYRRPGILQSFKSEFDKKFDVGSTITLPENISSLTYTQTSGGVKVKMLFRDCRATFQKAGCNWNIKFRFWLEATVNTDISITKGYIVCNDIESSGVIEDVDAENSKWYRFWNYIFCPFLEGGATALASIANFYFLNLYKADIADVKIPIGNLAGLRLPTGAVLTTEMIQEIRNAFPLNISLSVHSDGNLRVNVNILPQYSGSNPATVTNPSYDYIGFGCPYYAFQTLKNLPGITTVLQQEKFLIDTMAHFGAQAIRFALPWREIAPAMNINPDNTENPDNLTGTALDNAVNDILNNPDIWANTDEIISMAFNRKLDVIPQLLQQEADLPRIDNGTINPDYTLRGLHPVGPSNPGK